MHLYIIIAWFVLRRVEDLHGITNSRFRAPSPSGIIKSLSKMIIYIFFSSWEGRVVVLGLLDYEILLLLVRRVPIALPELPMLATQRAAGSKKKPLPICGLPFR
jgi:hypothetical protein